MKVLEFITLIINFIGSIISIFLLFMQKNSSIKQTANIINMQNSSFINIKTNHNSASTETKSAKDIETDNTNFKKTMTATASFIVFICIVVICSIFKYTKSKDIPTSDIHIMNTISKTADALRYSIYYSQLYFLGTSIIILCILIYVNQKNIYTYHRKFHIVAYSMSLFLAVIDCLEIGFLVNYKTYLPSSPITNSYSSIVLIMHYIFVVIFHFIFLIKPKTVYKSKRIRINFYNIAECTIFPLFEIFFVLYNLFLYFK